MFCVYLFYFFIYFLKRNYQLAAHAFTAVVFFHGVILRKDVANELRFLGFRRIDFLFTNRTH